MLLLAHAHNAEQLERYCIHFITMNETEIRSSRALQNFLEKADPTLQTTIMQMIQNEVEQSFIQIAISSLQKSKKPSQINFSLEQVATKRPGLSRQKQDEVVDENLNEIVLIENILGTHEYIFLQE